MWEVFYRRWSRCGIRVLGIAAYAFPGPGRYPLLRRDHWVLAIVETGEVTVDHVRRRFRCGPGEAYLIPPDIGLVELVADDAPRCRRTAVDFTVFATPGFANPLADLDLPLAAALPDAPEILAAIEVGNGSDRLPRRDQVAARGPVDGLIAAYLAALEAGGHDVGRPDPPWIADVERVMLAHLRDPDLDLAAIAAAVGVSIGRLAHAFKDARGIGPKARLRALRMERAVHMLQNLREPVVAEVAERCGYRSCSLFDRHFRAAFGTTPTAFAGRRSASGPRAGKASEGSADRRG